MLSGIRAIPGIAAAEAEGAFYLWLDVSALDPDDVRFCRRLLEETGVALTPGSAFLSPGYVRLAYTQSEPILADAIGRIASFCHC